MNEETVKFGAPLRISRIVLELSLNLQRDEDGNLLVTTESSPKVDEGLDWRVVFEKIDTPESPMPSGFYNFTYTESGSLAIQDMPIEVGEERREALRLQMRAFMRMHYNKLVSHMIHFPDRDDLQQIIPGLVQHCVSHHMVDAMVRDGAIDEGVRIRVVSEFDPTILHEEIEIEGERMLVGMFYQRGSMLIGLRHETDSSHTVRVCLITESIYREWIADCLVTQLQALVDEELPKAVATQIDQVEKDQGLLRQVIDAMRCSIGK